MVNEADVFISRIRREFPRFKLVYKNDSLMMKAIDVFLKVVTFGKQNRFMTNYTTTIGYKIYVASNWDSKLSEMKLIILRHERVHLRQMRKYTPIIFSLLYLFCLPTVFAFFRKAMEQAAYEESLKARLEIYGKESLSQQYKNHVVSQFTGSSYFWTWPFKKSIESWYDNTVEKVCKELDHGSDN